MFDDWTFRKSWPFDHISLFQSETVLSVKAANGIGTYYDWNLITVHADWGNNSQVLPIRYIIWVNSIIIYF